MKVVALTGGIGSGKSCALREFQKLGAKTISADEISHFIMRKGESAYNKTVAEFGDSILKSDGEINRKALAEIVFSDREKLERLNTITHKTIYQEIESQILSADTDIVCVEIPLLFNEECPIHLDLKIAVIADKETRISRVMKRDGSTAEQAKARMNRQLSDDEMCRYADLVIENNGDIKALARAAKQIIDKLR